MEICSCTVYTVHSRDTVADSRNVREKMERQDKRRTDGCKARHTETGGHTVRKAGIGRMAV